MAFLVSVDMSSNHGSFSLFEYVEDGVPRLLHSVNLEGQMKHSEGFFDALGALLQHASLTPQQISEWRANRGPGSFTGLRICLAALKAICAATHARLVLVDGAEARALRWARTHSSATPTKIKVCTYSTVRKSICHAYQWDGAFLSAPAISFVEQTPVGDSNTIVLSDKDDGAGTFWPSTSQGLLAAASLETLISAEERAAASPAYFATHEYTKAAERIG